MNTHQSVELEVACINTRNLEFELCFPYLCNDLIYWSISSYLQLWPRFTRVYAVPVCSFYNDIRYICCHGNWRIWCSFIFVSLHWIRCSKKFGPMWWIITRWLSTLRNIREFNTIILIILMIYSSLFKGQLCSNYFQLIYKSMGYCKKDITPLLMHCHC